MDEPRFVFFGGKGGVGKTTVSSAFGLRCARSGQRTLLVSTDPAHSTGDLFDQPFTDAPQPVDGYDNLEAMEIDPATEVDAHLQQLKRELGTQMSAAVVNEVDLQLEMAHRTPGAHEAALFDRFIDVMRDADPYDRVVFDTSPTGGTLRLLSLPDLLEGWIDRLIAKREQSIELYERAAIGNRAPRRQLDGDPVIARLQDRRKRFVFARDTLQDAARFHLVMNPDSLSLRETERALETLKEYELPIGPIVINKITPSPEAHEDGRGGRYLRQRCASERARMQEARDSLPVEVGAEIESRVQDVTGDVLEEVAAELDLPVGGQPA